MGVTNQALVISSQIFIEPGSRACPSKIPREPPPPTIRREGRTSVFIPMGFPPTPGMMQFNC
ncbi:unnamed protein product [Penicillium roqueforti FM164]|uniref:Uncharacterized protein n=1 Tax=Penicillium roqueforti (strain FM164) TaxID=1365484 RepID=W6R9I8_PENRF|nr:unnamed protein product [Penicillium roqueforti FM164]